MKSNEAEDVSTLLNIGAHGISNLKASVAIGCLAGSSVGADQLLGCLDLKPSKVLSTTRLSTLARQAMVKRMPTVSQLVSDDDWSSSFFAHNSDMALLRFAGWRNAVHQRNAIKPIYAEMSRKRTAVFEEHGAVQPFTLAEALEANPNLVYAVSGEDFATDAWWRDIREEHRKRSSRVGSANVQQQRAGLVRS